MIHVSKTWTRHSASIDRASTAYELTLQGGFPQPEEAKGTEGMKPAISGLGSATLWNRRTMNRVYQSASKKQKKDKKSLVRFSAEERL